MYVTRLKIELDDVPYKVIEYQHVKVHADQLHPHRQHGDGQHDQPRRRVLAGRPVRDDELHPIPGERDQGHGGRNGTAPSTSAPERFEKRPYRPKTLLNLKAIL